MFAYNNNVYINIIKNLQKLLIKYIINSKNSFEKKS